MALTLPLTPAGLEVDVAVNRDATTLLTLWQTGARPSPITGHGLIDTASDLSAVSLAIVQQLGTSSIGQTTTHGIGGSLVVNLYRVGLHLFDARNSNLPWVFHPTIVVMELAPGVPFDALIGLDILRACKVFLDGPGGQFTLDS
jgi:hypothetical protein